MTEYLGEGLSLTTKTNLPRNDSAGLEFAAAGQLLPKVSYSVSGNAFYTQIDVTALGSLGLKSTGLNVKAKLDYHPTADDSGQVIFTRTDKRLTPQGTVSAINIVNLGYKHALTPSLSAVATLSDIFDGQRYHRFVSTPTFTQVYERSVAGRIGRPHLHDRCRQARQAIRTLNTSPGDKRRSTPSATGSSCTGPASSPGIPPSCALRAA